MANIFINELEDKIKAYQLALSSKKTLSKLVFNKGNFDLLETPLPPMPDDPGVGGLGGQGEQKTDDFDPGLGGLGGDMDQKIFILNLRNFYHRV